MPEESAISQLRPMKCELGQLQKADGSCSYSQGRTTVWASCSGPGDVHITRRDYDKLNLDVSFRSTTGECQHHKFNSIIESALENVINQHHFPRASLMVTVHCMQDDGSLGAAALTATSLAMLDNGIPCKSAFCGVQISRVDGVLVIDPNERTQKKADATFLFAFVPANDRTCSVIASDCSGQFTMTEFQKAMKLGSEAARQIFDFYSETFKRKLNL